MTPDELELDLWQVPIINTPDVDWDTEIELQVNRAIAISLLAKGELTMAEFLDFLALDQGFDIPLYLDEVSRRLIEAQDPNFNPCNSSF